MVPRPLAGTASLSKELHSAHIGLPQKRSVPQLVQRWISSSWRFVPSQNAWSSGPGAGSGRLYSLVSSIVLVPPQHDRAARIRGARHDAEFGVGHLARRALVLVP